MAGSLDQLHHDGHELYHKGLEGGTEGHGERGRRVRDGWEADGFRVGRGGEGSTRGVCGLLVFKDPGGAAIREGGYGLTTKSSEESQKGTEEHKASFKLGLVPVVAAWRRVFRVRR